MNRFKKITIQSNVILLLSYTIIYKGQASQKFSVTFWDARRSKICFRMERRIGSRALQAGTAMKFQNKLIFIYWGDIFGQHLPVTGVGKFVDGFLHVPTGAEA